MLRRRTELYLILLLGGMLVAGAFFTYSYYYYRAPGPLTESTRVLFKKGTGFREIVDEMAAQGVIEHPLLFKAIAVILGDARKFKAGEYDFSATISPKLVMDMIAEGRVVVYKITIPEGLTVGEIMDVLNTHQALEGYVVGELAEGSLLPETFHFTRGENRNAIVERMQMSMKSTLAELWEKRAQDLPFSTPQEALTLASIVEEETGLDNERGRVAAVFINRLRKGMKLQSDPTVIYGIMQREHAAMKRPLTGADLKEDSPYNTYKIAGLPPGPICNPGRAAIEAVLNPPKTNELYFVATGNGGHNFAATLDEHNKNVRAYRAALNAKKQ